MVHSEDHECILHYLKDTLVESCIKKCDQAHSDINLEFELTKVFMVNCFFNNDLNLVFEIPQVMLISHQIRVGFIDVVTFFKVLILTGMNDRSSPPFV